MPRTAALALALASTVWGARAAAHADLDAARARYVEGDFAGALRSLERAEQEGPLTLDELIAVHELRVLLHRGLGDQGAADRALRTIAALRPDHDLAAEFPPVVRDRFAALARASSGPPRLAGSIAVAAGRATLTIETDGDDAHLVREILARARVAGGEWIRGGRTLAIDAPAGARIEWEAEARGPAGATLATARGSHDVPAAPPSAGGGGEAWPWVLAGGGLLVASAIVVVAVVLSSPTVDTQVEGPITATLRF